MVLYQLENRVQLLDKTLKVQKGYQKTPSFMYNLFCGTCKTMVNKIPELYLIAFGPKLRDMVDDAKNKFVAKASGNLELMNELLAEPIVVYIPNTTASTMELVVNLLADGYVDVPEDEIGNFNFNLSAFEIKATIPEVGNAQRVATTSASTLPVETRPITRSVPIKQENDVIDLSDSDVESASPSNGNERAASPPPEHRQTEQPNSDRVISGEHDTEAAPQVDQVNIGTGHSSDASVPNQAQIESCSESGSSCSVPEPGPSSGRRLSATKKTGNLRPPGHPPQPNNAADGQQESSAITYIKVRSDSISNNRPKPIKKLTVNGLEPRFTSAQASRESSVEVPTVQPESSSKNYLRIVSEKPVVTDYTCMICKKTFPTMPGHDSHMINDHGVPVFRPKAGVKKAERRWVFFQG